MGRPHLAHHVELQFHVYGQPLEHLRRIVLVHEQVRKKTGQRLPVAVSGIAEIAKHHYHRKDDLTLGGLLLWSHTAIYHGSLRADGQQTVLDAQVIASPTAARYRSSSRIIFLLALERLRRLDRRSPLGGIIVGMDALDGPAEQYVHRFSLSDGSWQGLETTETALAGPDFESSCSVFHHSI
jgi:hypothetical protein